MAVVFLLGPGMWGPERGAPAKPSPMDVRRDIAKALAGGGHRVVLMEDEPDRKGEDMIQKFDRLLRTKVTWVSFFRRMKVPLIHSRSGSMSIWRTQILSNPGTRLTASVSRWR